MYTWREINQSNWQFDHVGLIVRDLDRTLEYFQNLGLVSAFRETPKAPQGSPRPSATTAYTTLPGGEIWNIADVGSAKGGLKGRSFKMGSLAIEMIKPGEGVWDCNTEFLHSKGEGISHVCFYVDDLEVETAKLVEKGIPIVMTVTIENRDIMHYFDIHRFGGILLELLQKR